MTQQHLDRMTTATAVHVAKHHAHYNDDLLPTPDQEEISTLPHVYGNVHPFRESVSYHDAITFSRVSRFFLDPTNNYANLRTLVSIKTRKADIKTHKSDVSLRLIEFFLTKYVNGHKPGRDIGYFVQDGKQARYFNVALGYKNGLEMYTKKSFDFFARGKYKFWFGVRLKNKIVMEISTSLRQLNFFKWAIRNKVIDYTRKHRDNIMACMKRVDQADRENKKRSSDDITMMDVVEDDTDELVPCAKRVCT